MADNTLTFALGGRVLLEEFEQSVTLFRRLVSALTHRTEVDWVIEDLQPGSSVITLRGESEDTAKVAQTIQDYGDVGRALEHNEELQYTSRVVRAANAIKSLAQTVEYVRFETSDSDYTIYANGPARVQFPLAVSIGAVTGRVQTLTSRGSLRFNLYDTIHDKAIACYLQQGQEELMRKAWGRRARVSGRVSREGTSGRPVAVRHILDLEILEDVAPGSYRIAKGTVPWRPGYKTPEDIIRELRDA